ncbi:C39 family peptidase [Luteolibacter marinus]|uniref:C39 family peptidase n=1 Tax=Luteolibacter marinus TaxID=2776705 RepID=UPI001868C79C|nr:C39 family peptidase [Luteolibacter marinus]
MKIAIPLIVGLLTLSGHAAPKEKDRASLDGIVFDEALWTKNLEDLKSPDPEEEEGDAELRKQLKEKGITLGKKRPEGLTWLSGAKNGLRADPNSYELLGEKVGEVVIRGTDGKPTDATVSVYNRGDDGEIGLSDYTQRLDEWKRLLDDKLEVRSEVRNSRGAVALQGWMWRKGDTAVLLEGSVSKSDDRVEFIRLRFASISAAKNEPRRMARRGTFAENVKKDDKGFTYVSGIPMVDQGQKGYCVVATIERVARYFGADIDQHEMAQIADTDDSGTSGDDMEKAFQKVTGKIHLRTLKHIDYDDRQLEKDIRGYNRAAKAAKVRTFDLDPDEYYINPRHFWSVANKETFREMKRSQGGYDHFNRKIKEYVDQGIPLCWTLYLGMFKEEGLPQTYGGHMRLIIGYNPKTEMIMYTDSWGEGHEKKTMRADEAYCMTMALYSMVPNR